MQRRTVPSRFADRTLSSADLLRIQRWLRWLTMASVVAFVALSAEGAGWWAVRAFWAFVGMLALDLLVAVPLELIRLHRLWTVRRQARQDLGDAYDEIIASRKHRSE